ncbi:MAG: CDP-diacylglycerol--glycerol-3-phosphate 3-phosphatidyltransferase [Ignavibacteria bacterium]|nr:CDP-diacylglycerol--glycerol-3-phosphate 3-phosphatidyltransferase [Bacteroidota bacterium]MBL7129258.1 CDP-diacylglycerol--glycerol-3-phosphate 3-phosphatidyltransferase [Ignavibacteria bacterium]
MTFPNQLSIIRIILSPVFLFMYFSGDKLVKQLSLLVFFVAVLTDWYDGWHARKFKSVTRTGIFLDPLADKILTSFAFILFFIEGIMPSWMMLVIVIRDIVITVLRSYNEYTGKTLKTSYIAKVKTFVQMTYIFLILFLLVLITFDIGYSLKVVINNFLDSNTNYYLMLLVTLLTFYTGISYFFEKKTQKNV